jgi:hypothetical protein
MNDFGALSFADIAGRRTIAVARAFRRPHDGVLVHDLRRSERSRAAGSTRVRALDASARAPAGPDDDVRPGATCGRLRARDRPATLSTMGRVAFGLALLCSLAACQQDQSVRTEIVPIARGDFYSLTWGATQVDRFYSVVRTAPASRDENPTPEALLISPNHDQPCSLGDDIWSITALRPRLLSKYALGSPSPARVLLTRDLDADGYATVNFADIDCNRRDFEVQNVGSRWDLFSPDYTSVKMAFLRKDNTLLYVDPWAEKSQEIAHDVDPKRIWRSEQNLAMVENGQLVIRDQQGNVLLRRGKNVYNYAPLSGGDFIYGDETGTYLVRSGKAKLIGPNSVCPRGMAQLDPFIPGGLAFLTTCDAGAALRVIDPNSDKHYDYDNADLGFGAISGFLVYTVQTDSTTQLWLVSNATPDKPTMIAERDPFTLAGMMSIQSGVIVLAAHETGPDSYTLWALQLSDPTHALTTLTDDLAGPPNVGDGMAAFLYKDGDLVLRNSNFSTEILRVPNSLGVQSGFVFSGKASGYAYLSSFDPTSRLGRLELQLVNGDHFVLADQVRQFSEVWWPERGLLYTTGGDDPGLKFARVDIPCEATSDTAWACGF